MKDHGAPATIGWRRSFKKSGLVFRVATPANRRFRVQEGTEGRLAGSPNERRRKQSISPLRIGGEMDCFASLAMTWRVSNFKQRVARMSAYAGALDAKNPDIAALPGYACRLLPSLRAKRSNPWRRAKKEWIASSLSLLAMTWRASLPAFHAPSSTRRQRPSIRHRPLRHRRRVRVHRHAAQQVERRVQRLVVLVVRRDPGLRAGLLGAVGRKVAAHRGFALQFGAALEFVRHVLQHFDIRRDALGLDRAAGGGEVARGGQRQRAIA